MKLPLMPMVLAALGTLLMTMNTFAATPPTVSETKPLQFTSEGHILAFTAKDVIVAAGSHALRVEFVGAQEVEPISASPATPDGKAAPLTRVTYPGIWDGIALAYDAPGGLLRSTYTLDPGADPAKIKLRYSAPVAVEDSGELKIAFATGAMHESAPIAWQEIAGRRVPVEVVFRGRSLNEVGFDFGPYNKAFPLTIEPTLTWNTFLGGISTDVGKGIAVDASGSIYIVGHCGTSWGNPIRPYTPHPRESWWLDMFVAKLDANGTLLWNTFLGGTSGDYGAGIALDASGNVFVTGYGSSAWGENPVLPWSAPSEAGAPFNSVVAKLDANGALLWHTFLGGGALYGQAIAVDARGDVYVTGEGMVPLQEGITPIRPFSGGGFDAFVAKFDTDGGFIWFTFLGGSGGSQKYWGWDKGRGVAVGADGSVYVTGSSSVGWGDWAFIGAYDQVFVAKLDGTGNLVWNQFFGVDGLDDRGNGIAVDTQSNIYVIGESNESWGDPIRPFTTAPYRPDAFVLKIDTNGTLIWNTFLGGTNNDYGSGIAIDAYGGVYVSGSSRDTWGTPVSPFAGGTDDAFVAKLSAIGVLDWNTFHGGIGRGARNGDYFAENAAAVAIGADGSLHVVGMSGSTWGDPVRAFTLYEWFCGGATCNSGDAFVAKLQSTVYEMPFVAIAANDATATENPLTAGQYTVTRTGPVVTITANDAMATEAGPTTGQYTVTRTGPTTAALTVNFAVSGTATTGSDYTGIGTSVTIPIGAASATITLTPIDDAAVETPEMVIVTLSANTAYTLGSPASATVTIASDDFISTPTLGTLTPSNLTCVPNLALNLTAVYSDANGYSNLKQVSFLVNTTTSTVNGIYLMHDRTVNKLYLYNNAGTGFVGSCTPGLAGRLSNTQGTLNCAATTVTGSGNNLTVNWNIKPKAAFVSATKRNLYLYASDISNATVGWTDRGDWKIKATNVAPTLGSVTPAIKTSASGVAQKFSAVYYDPDGYANLKQLYFHVNITTSRANGISLLYDRTVNKLYLYNDAGTKYVGSCTPGLAGRLSNTKGTLNCAATTVRGSGNNLTINWNITPKAAFVSAMKRNIFLSARDMSNASAGWKDKGDWTVISANILADDNQPERSGAH